MTSDFTKDLRMSAAKILAIDILLTLSLYLSVMFSVTYIKDFSLDTIVPEDLVVLGFPAPPNPPADVRRLTLESVDKYGYAFLPTEVQTPNGPVEGYLVIGSIPGIPDGKSGHAYAGYGVELPETFGASYCSQTFRTVGTLEKDTIFYELWGPSYLDGSAIMWLEPGDFLSGEASWHVGGLLHNAVFVSPDWNELIDLCVSLSEAGFNVNPAPMTGMFTDNVERIWAIGHCFDYAFWLSSGYCALCLCLCLCCVQLSVRRMREFCVHLLHGATRIRLFLRLFLFNAAVLFAPCTAVSIALRTVDFSTLVTVTVCLALALLISAVSYAFVRRDILTSILKGAR